MTSDRDFFATLLEWNELKRPHKCRQCQYETYWIPHSPPKLCPSCGDSYLEELC